MIMFPFILVAAVLLLCKMGSETANAKAQRKNIDNWHIVCKDWTIRATNAEIEERHEYRLKTSTDYRHIKSEVDRICPCIPEEQRTIENYLRVFLSQRGKILQIDTISGISTPLIPSAVPTLIRREKRKAFNDYMRWLDAELRKHGMQERMIFEPSHGAADKKFYELSEIDSLGLLDGRFVWTPQSIQYHLSSTV